MSNIYGLLGEKLSHSLSPKIHSMIFNEMGVEGYYHLFEVEKEKLKDSVEGLKSIKGVNVTIPYKVSVMNYLDEISKEAENIGAVNTIKFIKNKAIGYNTDYYGFGMMLKKYDVITNNKSAVVLGSGGAAKAVTRYLIDNDIKEITIVSRNTTNAKEKFENFNVISYDDIKFIKNKDIIINCTPCGMYPKVDDMPIKNEEFTKFETAVDLIYNPKETNFLRCGREHGLKIVNGLYMLVGQAVKAQEIWNDINIDVEIIDKIEQELSKNFY